jgi:hypothetical protein
MLLDESWEMPSVKSPVENVLPIYYLFSNCVMRVCSSCTAFTNAATIGL